MQGLPSRSSFGGQKQARLRVANSLAKLRRGILRLTQLRLVYRAGARRRRAKDGGPDLSQMEPVGQLAPGGGALLSCGVGSIWPNHFYFRPSGKGCEWTSLAAPTCDERREAIRLNRISGTSVAPAPGMPELSQEGTELALDLQQPTTAAGTYGNPNCRRSPA